MTDTTALGQALAYLTKEQYYHLKSSHEYIQISNQINEVVELITATHRQELNR